MKLYMFMPSNILNINEKVYIYLLYIIENLNMTMK